MIDLFDQMGMQLTSLPRVRSTDPLPSHLAAAESYSFSGSHAERILKAIQHAPGQTPAYYAAMTGLTVVQIDRRLPEMRARGLVEPTGQVYDGYRVWDVA